MKKALLLTLSALLSTALLTAPPAQASSMPKADGSHSSFAIGIGPSAALDLELFPRTTLGVSAGLPFLVNGWTDLSSRYDLRLMTNLYHDHHYYHDGGFSLSLILGVWGDANFRDLTVSRWLGIEVGLAMAYRFNEHLTARVNLVPGYNFFNGNLNQLVFQNFFPPAAGAEVAWHISPNLEATLGYNGQGDILGFRFKI
ncbi:hypothetical protein COW36_18530 [bacterium (Candidatus Blackallbacteria) CG17_big_fil_post_rev_8_21_14_2_50_48_46]|uniref:Outer membrane protein beta-barrel domain-containing protein n=1 Tax=bacterium (Candidatus Blackallbacteria) CG17_big_fil_post_rev_8_21_14_2_50_48_46 TaxID=2014261 RepID=A0A2M7G128_9BACT|nr:MAG: hypothetical protein COW64_00205 [bacterium (Candidatus Blackallbacteria) CG18_big_fil_WC_8_21_14_2_50_49_26]PIW15411.1 MAG: hypothetical protein COW36_18530 [bacterium (Candidatus Blackallbacteria) CG17_big_fil_post_rev_8_21_14_2_50_48_46]PIW49728.1 MAG: hypothetical protein COW20_04835 [bacterium (Candidatus Blackallbacteria) CG13_big_fil_rev_8_21_14_2_50_49_14]